MTKRLVQGVGNYVQGEYLCISGGKVTKEYALWQSMLERCYNKRLHARAPTYIGCSVSEQFKDFQVFATWVSKQIGFGVSGFQLDKDLLGNGSKVYGENTCIFVPMVINMLLVNSGAIRGIYPVGVHRSHDMFTAKIKRGAGKAEYIGRFPTPELAFTAYKTFKEAHIRTVAEQWKDQIDPRAYAALMAYEILITD